VKIAVSRTKFQFLQEFFVVHNIERVEDIEFELFGLEESILHKGHWRVFCGHIVQKVCRLCWLLNDYLTSIEEWPPDSSLLRI
jgi:hypothetical protein